MQIASNAPIFTLNNQFPVQQTISPSPPGYAPGYTPMILTNCNGKQTLSTLTMPMVPVLQIDSNGFIIPSPSPVSNFPLFPTSVPLVVPPISRSPSPAPPDRRFVQSSSSQSLDASDSGSSRSSSVSSSVDTGFETKYFSDHRPKMGVYNTKKIPVPTFTAEMTKKTIVQDTLAWMKNVFGEDHFDCDGRRGPNVLRLKVKTRGSLEHICPLLNKLVAEGLIYYVSCPISTKKSRQHIRGYLAYIEAVSTDAINRIMHIFEDYNQILIRDCDGKLEHPFKSLSRNPVQKESTQL